MMDITKKKTVVGNTITIDSEEIKRDNIKHVLRLVKEALDERGYNSVNQLVGYLISNDPAYISSHKDARKMIQTLDRNDIIEELVRSYLSGDK